MKIQALIAVLLLPIGGLSAQVSIFERDFGQPTGDVLVLRNGTRPASLQGIQLLPIEVVGRTRLTELMPGSTRREELPGAARLVLPREKGSLYKYRRDEASGRARFGYFFVDAGGTARGVFELAGTGLTGTDDPLPGRVAVGPASNRVLVASSPAAGGDMWEIDLDAATAVNRTPDLPPRNFKESGLALLGTWGLGLADQGVYRFKRADGARATAVRVPVPTTTIASDVVTSADQSTVAFLAGDTINRTWVLTCGRVGDAVQASDLPMRIPGAGFLPEEQSGPHLALSTDGSWVAWRREGSSSECFVRETHPGPRPADAQITGPDHFDNTLNDTGVIAFFDPDSFVVMVGRNTSAGIGRGDLYRVDARPSGFTASNLSRTSGILQPPFDYGNMEESEGIFQLPGPTFLGHDSNLGGRILRFDANGSVDVVLDRVQSLDSLDLAGSHLVAAVTRPPGVDLPLDESLNLVQVPASGASATVIALPFGCHISRESALPTQNLFGGVLELEAGGEWLGRLPLPTATGATMSTVPMNFGPTTSMTPDGTLFATFLSGSRQLTVSWSDLGIRLVKASPRGSFLLPAL